VFLYFGVLECFGQAFPKHKNTDTPKHSFNRTKVIMLAAKKYFKRDKMPGSPHFSG
jgi:hypothetical protein